MADQTHPYNAQGLEDHIVSAQRQLSSQLILSLELAAQLLDFYAFFFARQYQCGINKLFGANKLSNFFAQSL